MKKICLFVLLAAVSVTLPAQTREQENAVASVEPLGVEVLVKTRATPQRDRFWWRGYHSVTRGIPVCAIQEVRIIIGGTPADMAYQDPKHGNVAAARPFLRAADRRTVNGKGPASEDYVLPRQYHPFTFAF